MSNSRVAVATLGVTSYNTLKSTWRTEPWATKVFTFFNDIDQNHLKFGNLESGSGVVPETNLSDIENKVWISGFVNFYWNREDKYVKWDSTSGGDECCQDKRNPVTEAGMQPQPLGIATQTSESATLSHSSTAIESGSPASTGGFSTIATATMTSTPALIDNFRSGGLSGSVVAGVAIGCLIAGGLTAFTVLWFCWSRRKAHRNRYSETTAMVLMPPNKGALTHTRSLGGGNLSHVSACAVLPQPLEDQAISGEISKISNSIKNHIQSYYHSKPVIPGLIDHDGIMALGHNLPISPEILSTLLDSTATREVALRFCVAWAVVVRLQNYGRSSESLLPPELCAPMREISSMDTGSRAHTLKSALWRVTTAELMRSTYVQDPFALSDSRNMAVHSLTQALESILQPFADSRIKTEERKSNLEEILKRSALFAFTIFSQPSSWDFDWKGNPLTTSGELCIFPALVQVTDEAGEHVKPPRSFSEAVIRRLDG